MDRTQRRPGACAPALIMEALRLFLDNFADWDSFVRIWPLLWQGLQLTALLAVAPSADPAGSGNIALVAMLAAVCTIAAVLAFTARGSILLAHNSLANGPVAAERRLHGAFRRVSSPDTPGRPRPRAPGAVPRPA